MVRVYVEFYELDKIKDSKIFGFMFEELKLREDLKIYEIGFTIAKRGCLKDCRVK